MMKKRFFIRIVSLVLLMCMLVPMVPAASAEEYLSYDWTGDYYKREGASAYKFALDDVLYNCYGFVIEYKLKEITSGSFPERITLEVCVGDRAGNWVVADLFTVTDEEIGKEQEIRVCLERPADIKYLAIISRNDNGVGYLYNLGIKEPIYDPEFYPWGHEGYFSDQKMTRGGYITYPLVLDSTLYGCMGFTLHYQLLQVNKGVFDLKTPYEVYIRDAANNWSLVNTFYMYGDERVVDVVWSKPTDVTQVAVIAKAKGKNEYRHYFAVTDAFTMGDYMGSYPYTKDGFLSAQWSDTKLSKSEGNTIPLVLEKPLINCKGFSLEYELLELTGAKLSKNSRCVVYYCTGKGTWVRAKECKVPEGYTTLDVKLTRPETITQVAVFFVPGGNGRYSYNHYFNLYHPVW